MRSELIEKSAVISICESIADTAAEYALTGEPNNARTREGMEAAATKIKHLVSHLPSTPSVEVGEMVEWLQHRSTVFVERGMIDHHKKLIKAASLLIALDAERGRMRTAVESAHGQFRDIRMLIPCDNYDETVRLIADRAVREMHRVLRSALPASDEK